MRILLSDIGFLWVLVFWGYIELLQVLKQKAALNSRMRHNKLSDII